MGRRADRQVGLALAALALAVPVMAAELIEGDHVRVSVKDSGAMAILDRDSRVTWTVPARLGTAAIETDQPQREIRLDRFTIERAGPREVSLVHSRGSAGDLVISLSVLPDGRTLEVAHTSTGSVKIVWMKFLEEAFPIDAREGGHVLVPVREGMLIPAEGGRRDSPWFGTYEYEGCHMAMLGMVKRGSALLASWDDPYVVPRTNLGERGITTSFTTARSARSLRFTFLGKGDGPEICREYRRHARVKGLVHTWDEKIARAPRAEKLIGASNFKLWHLLSRNVGARWGPPGARVNWTFTEAGEIAGHLKEDLGIDRALFIVGGWIRRGYDNQHPDILPANSECGGNAGLAALSRKVQELGYVFSLHDNYQDMYRDSPSWDEDCIMRDPAGNLVKGGVWAGGLAWLTCSKKALDLARRDQNLPSVKRLFSPDSYFIDTTYAAGLQECSHPDHPLTRLDDMRFKQELSDYARDLFGLFGSECGREWAIPHSDFFEGITGVSGRHYHNENLLPNTGGVSYPLFEMVFRDCIAAYGKYGYDYSSAAEYVLHHVAIGRPLNYHSFGPGLYWKESEVVPASPRVEGFRQTGPREFEISYGWSVTGTVAGDWAPFVHFVDPEEKRPGEFIAFQNDYRCATPASEWKAGTPVKAGPFRVAVPPGRHGQLDVVTGLWQPAAGRRAILSGYNHGNRRYLIGRLEVREDRIAFTPLEEIAPLDAGCFADGSGGWAAGMHPLDVFIKNTHEILSPLNALTARTLLTGYQFLTPDRLVRRATFGNGVTAVVNGGRENYRCRKTKATLPPYGFVVTSPEFVAFRALNWNGLKYRQPASFTIQSLDGKPLKKSRRIRVFHASGDPRVRVRGKTIEVPREMVFTPR